MNDMQQEKPYVTSCKAAVLLGVSKAAVEADIEAGMRGSLPSLIGARAGAFWYVPIWEVEGERLEMHKRRFALKELASESQVMGLYDTADTSAVGQP